MHFVMPTREIQPKAEVDDTEVPLEVHNLTIYDIYRIQISTRSEMTSNVLNTIHKHITGAQAELDVDTTRKPHCPGAIRSPPAFSAIYSTGAPHFDI